MADISELKIPELTVITIGRVLDKAKTRMTAKKATLVIGLWVQLPEKPENEGEFHFHDRITSLYLEPGYTESALDQTVLGELVDEYFSHPSAYALESAVDTAFGYRGCLTGMSGKWDTALADDETLFRLLLDRSTALEDLLTARGLADSVEVKLTGREDYRKYRW